MSLRDTIDAARQEAKQVADDRTISKDKDKAEDDKPEVAAYDPMKLGKRTAANGKPVTEAGASVRTGSGRASVEKQLTMTKEEKKAARREERAREDARTSAYDIVLHSTEGYKKTEKVWWILLGIGFACTIVSLVVAYAFPSTENGSWQSYTTIGALIGAYAFIIAAFVYDLVKRRPFRKAAEKRVAGMNDKRVAEFLAEDAKKKADEGK
jgi:hypothetical protein